MLNATYGRQVLPFAELRRHRDAPELEEGIGEPGVMRGQ
jgi:hypothetical protein